MIRPLPKPPVPRVKIQWLPSRERMTLCVAALAKVPNASFCKTNVVIYAADSQSEGEVAKAEIGKKVAQVGMEQHVALIAGTYSRAVDLAQMISSAMSEHPSKL